MVKKPIRYSKRYQNININNSPVPSWCIQKYTTLESQEDINDFFASMVYKGYRVRAIARAFRISPAQVSIKWREGNTRQEYVDNIPDKDTVELKLASHEESLLRAAALVARGKGEDRSNQSRLAASNNLNIMLRILYDEGHSLKSLADACDVSRAAISQRLSKTEVYQYSREDDMP